MHPNGVHTMSLKAGWCSNVLKEVTLFSLMCVSKHMKETIEVVLGPRDWSKGENVIHESLYWFFKQNGFHDRLCVWNGFDINSAARPLIGAKCSAEIKFTEENARMRPSVLVEKKKLKRKGMKGKFKGGGK